MSSLPVSNPVNVVFDFGAVVFTWRPADLMAKHLPEIAHTPDAAAGLARDIFHHDDWVGFDAGLNLLEPVVERTAKRLGIAYADLHAVLAPIGEKLEPIASSVKLLAQLKERRDAGEPIRLYFLSNMPAPFGRSLEKAHDFLTWFDGGIFSGDVKLVKPDPAIYLALQSRYELVPDQTLFIDDLSANVDAARALGWHAIHCVDALAMPADVWAHIERV